MRSWLWSALLLCLPLLSSCGQRSGTTPDAAATAEQTTPAPPQDVKAVAASEVVIDNFTYSPPILTVAVGTKVIWTNRDDVPHTVTSTSKPRRLDSPTLDNDESFAHVFTTPGTYEYYCAVHPKMTGRVIVK